MRRRPSLLAIAALSVASTAFAGDPPVSGPVAPSAPAATPPKGLAPGDVVPALECMDLDGKPFSLAAARAITPAEALEAVDAAAKASGATSPVKPEDTLEKVLGSTDGEKRAAFANAAGKRFGLVATAASTSEWKTVGDVAKWIEASAQAPIVFLCWSPSCPTSKLYEDRIIATIATTGARLFVLGCNVTDPVDSMRGYAEGKGLPYRVLPDHEQKITDVLGGRRTPHAFVVDSKGVLRYAGAVDNDAKAELAPEKRRAYLEDAIVAVKDGKSVEVLLTTPVG
jgi:hypothetical protein